MTMAAPLPTVADRLPLGASPNLTEGDGGGSTEIQCENISNENLGLDMLVFHRSLVQKK